MVKLPPSPRAPARSALLAHATAGAALMIALLLAPAAAQANWLSK
jgi:hypothetical protein